MVVRPEIPYEVLEPKLRDAAGRLQDDLLASTTIGARLALLAPGPATTWQRPVREPDDCYWECPENGSRVRVGDLGKRPPHGQAT